MPKIAIKVYSEICCDDCNEIVHNHMDCPACGREYVETDAYHDLMEDFWGFGYKDMKNPNGECIIECRSCKTKFRSTTPEPYNEDLEQWERVVEKEIPCLVNSIIKEEDEKLVKELMQISEKVKDDDQQK